MPDRAVPAVAVFDVNETLSDLNGLVAHFREAGVDPRMLPGWFAAALRDGFALTAAGGYADFAEIAVPTLIQALEKADGLRGDPRQVAEGIVMSMAELDLHPDVAAGLRQLRAGEVRIITLSNGSSSVAESLLERAGLRDLVERCLSVSDAGHWKPAAQAYAHAAESCAVDAGDMVLVAVHPWDIDGALRAGLRAVWLSRDGGPYPPFFLQPEATARTVSEVATLLTETG